MIRTLLVLVAVVALMAVAGFHVLRWTGRAAQIIDRGSRE